MIPTTLSVVQNTTAVCLKRVRADVFGLQSIPWLEHLSKKFDWTLQLATVDRYAANFLAEASLLHDTLGLEETSEAAPGAFPRFSKLTLPCDVHKAHQAHKPSFDLASADISGMLATCLSQHGTGTLQTLRQILATVLDQRLVIRYGEPKDAAHREAVYDLFLPLTERVEEGVENSASTRLLNMKRRMILARTLNGSLSQQEVQHWCGPGCCADQADTRRKFQQHVTFALLPGKVPKYAKNRWSHQFEAISWSGILFAHHNLGLSVILAFTGAPTPAPPASGDSAQARNQLFMLELADGLLGQCGQQEARQVTDYFMFVVGIGLNDD